MNNVAMVNVQSLLNGKDSRWLQLEVCREFQRGKCSRQDQECKYAHPAQNVEVQNGRVTACYDSIKGRCTRENPPCKYFHPPQHLKDQLLINGRNHLALKNAILQQLGLQPGQPSLPTMPLVSGTLVAPPASTYLDTLPYHQIHGKMYSPLLCAAPPVMPAIPPPISHPYLTGFTQLGGAAVYNPYLGGTAGMMPTIGAHDGLTTHTLPPAIMPANVMTPPAAQPPTHGHKLNRTDRLESVSVGASPGGQPREVHVDPLGKKRPRDPCDDLLLAGPVYKRPAGEKSGMPVYQSAAASSTAAYQQALMTLQQPFVPMSCEYPGTNISNGENITTTAVIGSTNNNTVPTTSKTTPSTALLTGYSLSKPNPPPPPPVLPAAPASPYWTPYNINTFLPPPTAPHPGLFANNFPYPTAGGVGTMGQWGQLGSIPKIIPPPPATIQAALQSAKKA